MKKILYSTLALHLSLSMACAASSNSDILSDILHDESKTFAASSSADVCTEHKAYTLGFFQFYPKDQSYEGTAVRLPSKVKYNFDLKIDLKSVGKSLRWEGIAQPAQGFLILNGMGIQDIAQEMPQVPESWWTAGMRIATASTEKKLIEMAKGKDSLKRPPYPARMIDYPEWELNPNYRRDATVEIVFRPDEAGRFSSHVKPYSKLMQEDASGTILPVDQVFPFDLFFVTRGPRPGMFCLRTDLHFTKNTRSLTARDNKAEILIADGNVLFDLSTTKTKQEWAKKGFFNLLHRALYNYAEPIEMVQKQLKPKLPSFSELMTYGTTVQSAFHTWFESFYPGPQDWKKTIVYGHFLRYFSPAGLKDIMENIQGMDEK